MGQDCGGFLLIVCNFSGKYEKGLLKMRMDKRSGSLGTFLFIPFCIMRRCTHYLTLSSIAAGSLHLKIFCLGHFLSPSSHPPTSALLSVMASPTFAALPKVTGERYPVPKVTG